MKRILFILSVSLTLFGCTKMPSKPDKEISNSNEGSKLSSGVSTNTAVLVDIIFSDSI